MHIPERDVVAATRQRPAARHARTFAALENGAHGSEEGPRPTELLLETTKPSGELADWLDDDWWLEAIRRWGDLALVVRILPSVAALLHPVVLHHVVMIRRVARKWRVVGYGYCGEIAGDTAVEALATSAYDEIHLVEGTRLPTGDSDPPKGSLQIDDLFKRVRQIQQSGGYARPVMVQATSLPEVSAEAALREADRSGHFQDSPTVRGTREQTGSAADGRG
jgi:hypothetical protein